MSSDRPFRSVSWDFDEGFRARRYASLPYDHYRSELFVVMAQILDLLEEKKGSPLRVLDIGAGPGHFTWEYYLARPESQTVFDLTDIGGSLLDIADERFAPMGKSVRTLQRDFNSPEWTDGLSGRGYDALVSNNALFNLTPERLGPFYREAAALLLDDDDADAQGGGGVLLNQQSFGPEAEGFDAVVRAIPTVLSSQDQLTPDEIAAMQAFRAAVASEKDDERALAKLAEEARARGEPVAQVKGYASLRLPASRHLAHLADAGFLAGVLWRKREFALILATKGDPFGATATVGT